MDNKNLVKTEKFEAMIQSLKDSPLQYYSKYYEITEQLNIHVSTISQKNEPITKLYDLFILITKHLLIPYDTFLRFFKLVLSSDEFSNEQKRLLYHYFLEDYYCVEGTTLFINWLIAKEELESTLSEFEFILNTFKCHVTQSAEIVSLIMNFLESEGKDDANETVKKKVDVLINKIYNERIETVHKNIEESFRMYSTLVTRTTNQNYEKIMVEANKKYQETLKLKEGIDEYEKYVELYIDNETAYLEYIKYLIMINKTQKLDKYIISLFRRALLQCQSNEQLTEYYMTYLINSSIKEIHASAEIDSIINRCKKGCFWNGKVLGIWLVYSHKHKKINVDESNNIIQEACSLDLLTRSIKNYNYLFTYGVHININEYKLRSIEKASVIDTFKNLIKILYSKFQNGDSELELYLMLAKFIAIEKEKNGINKDFEIIFKEVTKKHKNSVFAWMKYIEFEETSMNIHKARQLYKQCILIELDNSPVVFESYLKFECLNGDYESLITALMKIMKQKLIHNSKLMHSSFNESINQINEITKKEKLIEKNKKFKQKKKLEHKTERSKEKDYKKALENMNSTKNRTIFISSLENGTTPEMVQSHFSECGEIKSVRIHKETAYIEFEDIESVELAENLNLSSLPSQSSKILVHKRPQLERRDNTVFVCNFVDMTKDKLNEIFEKFGRIIDLRFPLTPKGVSRGFAYVEYENSNNAENAAQKMNGVEINSMKLKCDISDPSKRKPVDLSLAEMGSRILYVSNIPFSYAKSELVKLFSKYGNIESVNMIYKDAKFKGAAYIHYEHEEDGINALALNSTVVDGKILAVSIADKSKLTKKRASSTRADKENIVKRNKSTILLPRNVIMKQKLNIN